MSEQQWFAGLPVVAKRPLDSPDDERLCELARGIRTEAFTTFAILLGCIVGFVAVSVVSFATGMLGAILLSLTSGALRYLPRRRFFALRVLIGLHKDVRQPSVYVCHDGEMTLEVLLHSHVIWTRDGVPALPAVVAHATATAQVPEHAQRAANFVRPVDDDGTIFLHQRPLTEAELGELDSYAPNLDLTIVILGVVALVGCVATFALALTGRLSTLLPPFAFLVIGSVATLSAVRRWRARKVIALDLELGYVLIVRSKDLGELGPPEEMLPGSRIVWTENGQVAEWRRRSRRAK